MDLLAFAGDEKPKRKKSRGLRSQANAHSLARAAAQGRIDLYKQTGQVSAWSDAEPREIVGLYSLLHSRVYGVHPAELDGPDYLGAVSAARRVIKEIGGAAAFELVRWKWNQIEFRMQKGSDNGFRLGWRIQFSQATLVDFRVHVAGRKKRASSAR